MKKSAFLLLALTLMAAAPAFAEDDCPEGQQKDQYGVCVDIDASGQTAETGATGAANSTNSAATDTSTTTGDQSTASGSTAGTM